MKHVAILTRTHTDNLGTLLQAFALQKCIIDFLGYETHIIDSDVANYNFDNERDNTPKKSFKEVLYEYVDKKIDIIKYSYLNKRVKKIEKFKQRHINTCNYDTKYLNEYFDVFISGSDQIWAKLAEPQLYPFYMQSFVEKNHIKISYAISMGSSYYPYDEVPLVKGLLERFDSLSAREDVSKEILSQFTDKKIEIVCDPVFLIPKEYWANLAKIRRSKKYIFGYFLSNNEWYNNYINELKEYYNLPLFTYSKENIKYENCSRIDYCSPERFLGLIKDAEVVVTDSYHAFIFSIIFHKKVIVLERFGDEKNIMQNCRLTCLMNRLNISNCYIKKEDKYLFDVSIDYAKVDKQIEKFRKESIEYLSRGLIQKKENK